MSSSAAVPLPVRQRTPGWIDARRETIGSSDVPILTGNSPYRSSPVDLWAYKTRRLEPIPPSPELLELFDLGIALEPVIAASYAAKTGRPLVRRNRLLTRPDAPWASASLDRVSAVKGEQRIVELKWAPHARWADGPEPIPAHVQDQVQWQLFVTGWRVADVAVLERGRVEVHELERDDAYIDDLIAIADHFRAHVHAGTMPPIDGSEATRRALVRLSPRATLDYLEPTAELEAAARAWRDAELEAKSAVRELGRIKNAVRAILGEHAGARSEAWHIIYRQPKPKRGATAWELVAGSYRELLERVDRELSTEGVSVATLEALSSLDALVSVYTQPDSESTRTLRAYWKNAPADEEDDEPE